MIIHLQQIFKNELAETPIFMKSSSSIFLDRGRRPQTKLTGLLREFAPEFRANAERLLGWIAFILLYDEPHSSDAIMRNKMELSNGLRFIRNSFQGE